ncbi:MAG TPA: EpsI family protein [Gemmatimonadales bacterium]|nr:EpsI family protein [Gemmatimonadales bacterium]
MVPGVVIGLGAVLLMGVDRQQAVRLREPLGTISVEVETFTGRDRAMSQEERQVAGVDDYLLRDYERPEGGLAYSMYVGYYEQQTQGRTIHSPRNCLPGAGWEPVSVSPVPISLEQGPVTVRRYVLAKGASRALVYYWYQGRGRVASDEYRVKLDLLADAVLRGRTEEALVRIVVPITEEGRESGADSVAIQAARALIPALDRVLPEFR